MSICPECGKPGLKHSYPSGTDTYYHGETGELHKVEREAATICTNGTAVTPEEHE